MQLSLHYLWRSGFVQSSLNISSADSMKWLLFWMLFLCLSCDTANEMLMQFYKRVQS